MKKIFVVLFVLLISMTQVFAEPTSERNIIDEFKQQLEEYDKQYSEILNELKKAYQENDYSSYLEAKRELKELEYPQLEKSDYDELLSEIVKNDDYQAASWLYHNSISYRPVLEFKCDSDNFKYTNKITVEPGKDVILPTITTFDKTQKLAGWGLTKDEVTYQAGQTIKMPVSDQTLFAIFVENDEFVKVPSIRFDDMKIMYYNNMNLISGKQLDFVFDVTNNGNENFKDVNISFDSDDPLLVILTDSVNISSLRIGDTAKLKFKVITKAKSSTKLEGIITVKDLSGNTFKQNVVFTVE